MSNPTLAGDASVKMIAFDCLGEKYVRLDDVLALKNSAKTPFAHTFRQLLTKNPSTFQWDVPLQAAPKIALCWECVFRSAGVCHIQLGEQLAALAILLRGASDQGEEVVLESLADHLASRPGMTLRPALDEIRCEQQRPLLAVLNFRSIDDPIKSSAIQGIVFSLALAYFSPLASGSADTAMPTSA